MIAPHSQPFSVALIEDDEGHASLINRNLQRAGVLNPITRLRDGAEALAYFFGDRPPDQPLDRTVVVLDLNLPDIDGFEILGRLKTDERTRRIPVIVLTTTDNPRDIDRCYALGCNAFMTKPVGYNDFSEAIQKLGLMLTIVRVPHTRP
ncbi:MAG: response regulator [Asticcacaulis sp.]|uniref:response regulator n=1 Tax=Asticcacaulis sp. TaxID=1872648 RepID=UPI0039E2DBCA